MTRIQKERFTDKEVYESVKDIYEVTPKTLEIAKPTMSLMHPFPRVGEISNEVDSDPRAAYFREIKNGLYVRMVLLAGVLGKLST
jgi:carbamoyl-phosphate synthase/aspartate carbamoyltransferase/dihydroorotase/carbamoyl-phosphate synthase/aspartate carbamoyltransferase